MVRDDAGRAEIPPMLSEEQRHALAYTPRCRQRWGERQTGGAAHLLAPEDVQEFLTQFAWLKETEVALQCLFDGEFNLSKAVQLLLAARRERHKTQRDRNERLQPEAFKAAVETHGKKFHRVQQALGQKVITQEVVSKYYLWKRTTEFKEWRQRQTVKKTRQKKKEAELLRQWGEEDEADSETQAFLSYHNEHCELCATGGKLLCCDGCARAYHFSCVQPPITKVPSKDEDWFCQYCQEAFGGPKPKMVPSDDNGYCQMCVPFPGVPRMLIESMTDGSSQEDSDELEQNSDEDAASSDEMASEHDGDLSDFPSTDEVTSNAGNSGSLTDNESDSTSVKIPSASPRADSSNPGRKSTPAVDVAAQYQTSETEVESSSGLLQVATTTPMGRPVESSPAGARREPPEQPERSGSGRKRQRKTLAPRRIPPSRFDS
ncbi:hypothetical protein PRIC2_007351 [Phytophthora ramorum]